MAFKAPRGTRDMLPLESDKWNFVERKFRELCYNYNFAEIRTPVFEETELFVRSAGEESDVVKKEMYIFKDRGGRELALRPEGTAGVVRAYLEHSLHNNAQPVKLFYYGPMFRYDRPQAGRQRQFYQMGIEIFGTKDPASDVEVIKFTADFFSKLGFKDLKLHINSVGCPECRPLFQKDLEEFARTKISLLCGDCRKRALNNPLRLLDCKNDSCREVMKDSSPINAYLCSSCGTHFEDVLKLLKALNISFYVDSGLVRGLDYYTNTAFEFLSCQLGSQNALGGGGRYDNLVEHCGGPQVPGVGMAVGVERILLALEKEELFPVKDQPEGVFLAVESTDLWEERFNLLYLLRDNDFRVETDYLNRSLKAQMKFANRNSFRFVIIMGVEDKSKGIVKLRDMVNGEQVELSFEKIPAFLRKKIE
ncbi:MAG: histidine--tRNA ligase [Bacillota bacterium]|nr:histidine--tRNA ligase [Bacillota bacterium]